MAQVFYTTDLAPCPYLKGQMERKVFTELSGAEAQRRYGILSLAGFRRSHRFAYRPACPRCNACIAVRIAVPQFWPSRSQRRLHRLNADLAVTLRPPVATAEQFGLFRRYLEARHGDGEMVNMTSGDYAEMVEQGGVTPEIAEFRDPEGGLLAVLLADHLADGCSAVYSFFDPEAARRSLGTYMILWLVGRAQREGWAHVYLGYWIAGTPKMAYKTRFSALEALAPEGWRPFGREARRQG